MNNTRQEQQVPEEQPQNQMTKKEEREVQAYVSGLARLLHGKETSNNVYEILKSDDPQVSIPKAALLINNQMEEATRSKGKPPSLKTLVSGAVYLVSDLIEVGHAGGFFQIEQQDVQGILQSTIEQYIVDGVKKGTVDPMEIQQIAENEMTDEQKAQGLRAGAATGVAPEAGQEAAMEAYAASRERKVANKYQKKMSALQKNQQVQGEPQGQPLGGNR